MKVKSIKKVGKLPVYDLSIEDVHYYVTENGVINHNTGLQYSANTIIFTSKSMEKQGTEQVGNNFSLTINKSRFVREKAKIPVTMLFDGGISKWSGLLDMALASGHVIKPSNGWYQKVNKETGEIEEKKYRAKDTNTHEFWDSIIKDKTFNDWIAHTFKIANESLLKDGTNVEQEVNEQFTDSSL